MLRKSNVVLKAITMGALLANGGIGTEGEDDKQKKGLNIPVHNTRAAEIGEKRGGDLYHSLIEPHVKNILLRVDERAEMRRELLRKPIKVDLRGEPIRGVLPLQKVLNTLLTDAHKYGVPLNLTLLNASTAELNEILNHTHAQYINELDWTYEVPLMDNMDAYDLSLDEETAELTPTSSDADEEWIDETIEFTPTPEDTDEEWIDETVEFTPTPDDTDEEWIDDPIRAAVDDDLDEEWGYDLLGFMRDDLDEELIDGVLEVMGHDPVGVVKVVPLVPRLRRVAARARYMPPLHELMDNLGQKGIIAPPKKIVVDKAVVEQENYNPQLSGWSMTPIKNAEKNSDSNAQDLDRIKKLTHRASHNLVQIFCRGS